MSHPFEWFCEEIQRILGTRDMFDIDETAIDTVTNNVTGSTVVHLAGRGMGKMGG